MSHFRSQKFFHNLFISPYNPTRSLTQDKRWQMNSLRHKFLNDTNVSFPCEFSVVYILHSTPPICLFHFQINILRKSSQKTVSINLTILSLKVQCPERMQKFTKLLNSRIFQTMMISLDVRYAVSQTNMIIKFMFSLALEIISLTIESI